MAQLTSTRNRVYRCWRAARKLLEELAQESLFQNQQDGEVESPDEKFQLALVPDAGGRPHHQKVEKQPGLAHPVASQGDIEVLPEPGAEGDVCHRRQNSVTDLAI